jgi:thymidylate synthase (FAD)
MKYIKVKLPEEVSEYPESVSLTLAGGKTVTGEVFKPEYKQVHEHGFVGLVDFMGEDHDVTEAARTSYAKGTKTLRNNRGLIRYLTRKLHTSPIEMVEFKFHVKCPIFIARQWLRHRTASVNEMSARYSELPDVFYVPEIEYLAPQSTLNNQGRGGELSYMEKEAIRLAIDESHVSSFETYEYLLKGKPIPREIMNRVTHLRSEVLKDLREKSDIEERTISQEEVDEALNNISYPVLGDDYEGLARELARIVVPVSVYTEFYWKIDMHNLFHFLKLRMDSHAQKEIQDYGNVIADLIRDKLPLAWEAFEDYRLNGASMSRMEMNLIKKVFKEVPEEEIRNFLNDEGCANREVDEFIKEIKNV